MGRLQSAKQLVAFGVTSGMLLAGTLAYADAPAPKWYDTIGISGYTQASYVGNLNAPTDITYNPNGSVAQTGVKANNVGRQFDTDSNGFSFNTFLLQIAKPVGDTDHYGFTTRIRMGQDAETLNGNNTPIFLQEGYITYVVPALTKLSLIGGKFVTPEGYEGVDTVNNPNFSEGLLFTYAEPITHTGIKANYTISDKANATIGVVNGWDVNNPDNNTAKTILWQLATTPTKALAWSFQGLYGKETADPSQGQRLSLDTVASYSITDKLSVAGQGNWGQQTDSPTPGGATGTTHWSGLGAWLSYATNAMFTESVRFEVMADQNNADRFGGNFADGTNQTVKEFTVTHKTMLTSALGNRIEYRHDWSNQGYFLNEASGSPAPGAPAVVTGVSNQNTISTDFFVLF